MHVKHNQGDKDTLQNTQCKLNTGTKNFFLLHLNSARLAFLWRSEGGTLKIIKP